MTRRYIVIGAGAVGIALAAALTDAGIEAVLVSRGATYDAIRRNGIAFTHVGRRRRLGVEVVDGPASVGLRDDDILVFATKSQDVAPALALWARQDADGATAGERLIALTTQNGLDAERTALRHFGRVVSGTTLIAARHVVPGEVEVLNGPAFGQLVLGPEGAPEETVTAAEVAEIAGDLRSGGWLVHETDAPRRWKAWKALNSVAFPVDVLAGTDDERDRLRALVRAEARTELASAGYDFADPAELSYDRTLSAVQPDHGFVPGQLSTWQSFERGAGSEADYLAGEVVLRARLRGTDAPASRLVQSVLAAAEAAGERPGQRQASVILDALSRGSSAVHRDGALS